MGSDQNNSHTTAELIMVYPHLLSRSHMAGHLERSVCVCGVDYLSMKDRKQRQLVNDGRAALFRVTGNLRDTQTPSDIAGHLVDLFTVNGVHVLIFLQPS